MDFDEGREFVKMCQIRAVPCGHLYADGKLKAAMNMGPAKWDDYRAELDTLLGKLQLV